LIIYKKTRTTPLGVGSLIFLLTYAVYSKFFVQISELMAERQMYFPSFGIALILGFLFLRAFQYKKELTAGLFMLLLVFYSITIAIRNYAWLNSESLYKSMVNDSPHSIMGYLGLSALRLEQGDLFEAKFYSDKANSIYPDHAPALEIKALIYLALNDFEKAEQATKRAMRLRPGIFRNYENYATILSKKGKFKESIAFVNKLSAELLNRTQIRFIMAYNYYKLGDISKAMEYFDFDKQKTDKEKLEILDKYGN
jgi:tetratricopeptide (TPR) repeat protein